MIYLEQNCDFPGHHHHIITINHHLITIHYHSLAYNHQELAMNGSPPDSRWWPLSEKFHIPKDAMAVSGGAHIGVRLVRRRVAKGIQVVPQNQPLDVTPIFYICICIYICVCDAHIYMYIYMCIYIYIYVYINKKYIYIYTHMCEFKCTYIHIYI